MKPFEKWETEEVERTFGIKQQDESPLMQTWTSFKTTFPAKITERAEELRIKLKKMADFWSEEDIKVFFLIPVIELIEFYVPDMYRTFMEASLQADLQDVKQNTLLIKGRVEMVVATGKQKPQTPLFFLNEYKPQIKSQSDPKGQLLSAMLVAQAKNALENLLIPMYGLYTIGQNWFFVVLAGKEYIISKQYDTTEIEDLMQALNMLQFVKNHIEAVLGYERK